MELTAVEWLVDKLSNYDSKMIELFDKEIEQAKEMEKQQIINAYLKDRPKANINKVLDTWDNAEQYYNETFKNK